MFFRKKVVPLRKICYITYEKSIHFRSSLPFLL